MSDVDDLIQAYKKHASLPWIPNLAAGQRTWMVVYSPVEERRIRARLSDFENATRAAGKDWLLVDISTSFGEWIDVHPYRDRYFANPNSLSGAALRALRDYVIKKISEAASEKPDPDTVVAVVGVGTLFPFTEISGIIESAADLVTGRLAVFFPGDHRQDNYRLLDARDGWNYLATAITPQEGRLS